MAGNYVFPGGVVDAEDRDFANWRRAVDMDAEGIRRRLAGGGLTVAEAAAYGVAAIRETVEEAGVLLGHAAGSVAPLQETLDAYRRRRKKGGEDRGFERLVFSNNWRLALSGLSRWSHWITPKRMKRHYDTRFFLAVLPVGQECQPDGCETTKGVWVTPKHGLAANIAGKIPLSPPTLVTLHGLLPFENLDNLLRAADRRPWGPPVHPRLVPMAQGAILVEPWDPMYQRRRIPVEMQDFRRAVLDVGQPFSRLWYDNGIWRPVAL
jgi:8-oxo-dGTP pyrophosphatase MutT (NUDIX family)